MTPKPADPREVLSEAVWKILWPEIPWPGPISGPAITGRYADSIIAALTSADLEIREKLPEYIVAVRVQDIKLLITRMEILTGRMRACHEETGKHELLSEAEAFCEEAKIMIAAYKPEGR